MGFVPLLMSKLTHLIKFPQFKQKLVETLGLTASVADDALISKAKQWMVANPGKAGAFGSTVLALMPMALTQVFTTEELPLVAKGIEEFSVRDDVNSSTNDKLFSQKMGDGEAGIGGFNSTEVMSQALLVKRSIARTEEIAAILGVRPSEVGTLVKLLSSVEPEDQEIYKTMRA